MDQGAAQIVWTTLDAFTEWTALAVCTALAALTVCIALAVWTALPASTVWTALAVWTAPYACQLQGTGPYACELEEQHQAAKEPNAAMVPTSKAADHRGEVDWPCA